MKITLKAGRFFAAAVLLWFACAVLLLAVAPPVQWIEAQHRFHANFLFLAEDATMAVCMCCVIWIPVHLSRLSRSGIKRAACISLLTWITLGLGLWYLVLADGLSAGAPGFARSMSLAFSNGQGILIEPIVVPCIAVLSGAAYYFWAGGAGLGSENRT